MMKRLIVLGMLLAIGGASVFLYRDYRKQQCIGWFEGAQNSEKAGYFASAIETLTIYFSTDSCRSKLDPQAVAILANSRLHVPLPENSHLAQQLMLNRLGWSLKRDPKFYLPQATAFLGAGRWQEAQNAALKASGPEAALILIAASAKLSDEKGMEYGLLHLRDSGASEFQWALVKNLIEDQTLFSGDLHEFFPNISHGVEAFAAALLSLEMEKGILEGFDSKLFLINEMDLTIASSMLIASGRAKDVVSILEAGTDLLTDKLVIKLAKTRWNLGQYELLATGDPILEKAGKNLAEIQLVKCLAQISIGTNCNVAFYQQDYAARHGKFATAKWGDLFDALSSPSPNVTHMINAINAAGDLLKGIGAIHQYHTALLAKIGEPELAQYYFARGNMLSGKSPAWPDLEKVANNIANSSCVDEQPSLTPVMLPVWQQCVEAGLPLSAETITNLRSISPDQATFWRLLEARYLLKQGNDEDAARAINLLRPVIRWVPKKARPHQMIASAYAHFGDMEAAYGHLATSVKLRPEFSVEASRLALGFYLKERKLSAEQLVHWWVSLTYIELAARSETDSARTRALLADRLLLLAEVAEQKSDATLAKAAYTKLLEAETANHVALNNLAYKIFETQGDLQRALKLARKAVFVAPQVQEYGNTLKDIQLAIEAEAS